MNTAKTRVVITGASSGIGAATALAFAGQGSHLVLGARGEEGLADIARRCREAGGQAETRVVDVTDAAAVVAFAAEARAVLGEIDLWFSNVGIGVVGKYLDVPMTAHRQVIDTNLLGHMNDAHAVLPIFLAQERGTWVNMISVGGFVASPYAAAYAASKFGLRGFSAALRGEVAQQPHIHICDVYPTFVDTPGIVHGGNYTGAKLVYPPGVLAPEKVARAVVRLARHPRPTTVVGMPAFLLRLSEFAAPNLPATLMNNFMDKWTAQAEPARDTTGTIYGPAGEASGVSYGQRRASSQPKAALLAGAALGVVALGALLWRRS